MSPLVDRITAVQRQHRYTPFTGICPCGFQFDIREDHEAHVAERITEALQLTEERWHPESPAGRRRWVTPWVSAWSAAEEKP